MSEHPALARMWAAGFDLLPMLNSSGVDDGLIFWRWSEDQTVLDLVAVWSDDYAVWTRLPSRRDWSRLFEPTVRDRVRPRSFAEIVDAVQPRQRPSVRPPADDGGREWFGSGDV